MGTSVGGLGTGLGNAGSLCAQSCTRNRVMLRAPSAAKAFEFMWGTVIMCGPEW